jgi:hypothetical protein
MFANFYINHWDGKGHKQDDQMSLRKKIAQILAHTIFVNINA